MNDISRNNEAIVCFGDSITQGAGLPTNERWTDKLQGSLNEWRPDTYTVHNCGVGGNTTAHAIERINSDVVSLLPGLVLLEFGFNDAYVFPWSRIPRLSLEEYERNLLEIIRILKTNDGKVILLRNHSNRCMHKQGNGKPFEENFARYDEATREIAANGKIPIIDLPKLMMEYEITIDDMVSEDGLHLSKNGNKLYAKLLSPTLIHWFEHNESGY